MNKDSSGSILRTGGAIKRTGGSAGAKYSIGLVVVKRPRYGFLFGFLKNTVDRLFRDATAICNRLLTEIETIESQNLAILGHKSDLL